MERKLAFFKSFLKLILQAILYLSLFPGKNVSTDGVLGFAVSKKLAEK